MRFTSFHSQCTVYKIASYVWTVGVCSRYCHCLRDDSEECLQFICADVSRSFVILVMWLQNSLGCLFDSCSCAHWVPIIRITYHWSTSTAPTLWPRSGWLTLDCQTTLSCWQTSTSEGRGAAVLVQTFPCDWSRRLCSELADDWRVHQSSWQRRWFLQPDPAFGD